jgi:hypothetical protein
MWTALRLCLSLYPFHCLLVELRVCCSGVIHNLDAMVHVPTVNTTGIRESNVKNSISWNQFLPQMKVQNCEYGVFNTPVWVSNSPVLHSKPFASWTSHGGYPGFLQPIIHKALQACTKPNPPGSLLSVTFCGPIYRNVTLPVIVIAEDSSHQIKGSEHFFWYSLP